MFMEHIQLFVAGWFWTLVLWQARMIRKSLLVLLELAQPLPAHSESAVF
jgi:hypothetical protein